MFAQKLLLPALAVLGLVAAQSSSTTPSCTNAKATITINSQADVTAISSCDTVAGSILVGPDASGEIDLDGPKSVSGSLIVSDAGQLISLRSSSIESIATSSGSLRLFNLTLLSTLAFTELTHVGTLYFEGLPALSTLTFPASLSKASSVTITNTFLSTLDGINLMSVALLDINNNNRLTTFSTQIGTISNSINIASNGMKLEVDFPNLLWANNMTFRNVSKLSIPSLNKVNGSLIFDDNFFTTVSAPNLTTVGNSGTSSGSLAFVANSKLTNITIPGLTGIGGGVQVANNSALQTISFPVLKNVGGAIDLSGNFTTPNLPAIDNVVGALNIQSTAVIDCTTFNSLKSSGSVQGKENCVSKTKDPETLSSGSATKTGGGSSSTSSSKAAGPTQFGISEAVAGLSVVGGIMQMIL